MRRSLSVLKMCLPLSCSSVIFAAAALSQQTAPKPAPPVDPIGLPPPLSEDLSLIENWLDTLSDQAVSEGSLAPSLGDQPDAPPIRPTEPAELDWDLIDRLELETRLRNEGLLRKRSDVMWQWMRRTQSLLPATAGSRPTDQTPQADANPENLPSDMPSRSHTPSREASPVPAITPQREPAPSPAQAPEPEPLSSAMWTPPPSIPGVSIVVMN